MGTRVKQPDDFKRKNKSRWPWQGELGLAETIPWSLLNFLHFRCLSPSGGCRKAKYPDAWGGGSGTGQGMRCCRETLLAGRRTYGARAAHLHLARCVFSARPGKKQSLQETEPLQAACCKALLFGDLETEHAELLLHKGEETPSHQRWALAHESGWAQAGLSPCEKTA